MIPIDRVAADRAKHHPLPTPIQAVQKHYNNGDRPPVSTNPHVPATQTSVVRNVIHDHNDIVQGIYQHAIDAAGQIISDISDALAETPTGAQEHPVTPVALGGAGEGGGDPPPTLTDPGTVHDPTTVQPDQPEDEPAPQPDPAGAGQGSGSKCDSRDIIQATAQEVADGGLDALDAGLSEDQWKALDAEGWRIWQYRGSEVHKLTALRLVRRSV